MKSILVILLVIGMLVLVGCGSKYIREDVDKLANCLAENDVKEYGAFWCSNCAKQEKMFGSSYKIIKERGVYVECDARGKNPQSDLCLELDITKYPTWEFSGKLEPPGVLSFEELAIKSGCEAPRLAA
jgi:hypothetical protein